jgi:hypothetical protein
VFFNAGSGVRAVEIDLAKFADRAKKDAKRAETLEAAVSILRNASVHEVDIEISFGDRPDGCAAATIVVEQIKKAWDDVASKSFHEAHRELSEIYMMYAPFDAERKL